MLKHPKLNHCSRNCKQFILFYSKESAKIFADCINAFDKLEQEEKNIYYTLLLDNKFFTRFNERECSVDDVSFTVVSTIYNEGENQYIIKDGYLDKLYIEKAKTELAAKIKSISSASNVKISLYPDSKCYFIGDCEANENYNKETNIDNLYNYSKELKLDNYLNLSKEDFINKYQFKIVIIVKGDYDDFGSESYYNTDYGVRMVIEIPTSELQ